MLPLHSEWNSATLWEVILKRTPALWTCLPCNDLLSQTPLWPTAGRTRGTVATFLMKAQCLICKCVFSFIPRGTTESGPASTVIQHECRLIHYPLKAEACGLRSSSWRSFFFFMCSGDQQQFNSIQFFLVPVLRPCATQIGIMRWGDPNCVHRYCAVLHPGAFLHLQLSSLPRSCSFICAFIRQWENQAGRGINWNSCQTKETTNRQVFPGHGCI